MAAFSIAPSTMSRAASPSTWKAICRVPFFQCFLIAASTSEVGSTFWGGAEGGGGLGSGVQRLALWRAREGWWSGSEGLEAFGASLKALGVWGVGRRGL